MSISLPDWRIVLVRPRNPLNIGAAARAMANFGLTDLAVVEPYVQAWQEARSAIGGERVMRAAKSIHSLADALADVQLVLGTTSGQRRTVEAPYLSLERLSDWLDARPEGGKAALLFGSEKTGLSNEHLSFCQALVRIPTVPESPSMNLGQAVAVCCFELARAAKSLQPLKSAVRVSEASAPASVQCLEHVFERAVRVLDEVGFLKPKSRQTTVIKLRRLLVERGLSNYDARILGGLLAQIEWKLRHG
jgi:TrmH family RNA methyltransferase